MFGEHRREEGQVFGINALEMKGEMEVIPDVDPGNRLVPGRIQVTLRVRIDQGTPGEGHVAGGDRLPVRPAQTGPQPVADVHGVRRPVQLGVQPGQACVEGGVDLSRRQLLVEHGGQVGRRFPVPDDQGSPLVADLLGRVGGQGYRGGAGAGRKAGGTNRRISTTGQQPRQAET